VGGAGLVDNMHHSRQRSVPRQGLSTLSTAVESRTWSCSSEYVWRRLSDGGLFVVHVATGEQLWLGATAGHFMDLVQRGCCFDAILSDFRETDPMDAEQLARDLVVVAHELSDIGLLLPDYGEGDRVSH
jgi:hypothetical protein